MGWSTTGNVHEFLAEAGDFLSADRARNTVILAVAENLRVSPPPPGERARDEPAAASDEPLFGWWRPDAAPGQVRGAFMHTATFPVVLTAMSRPAATELARDLAGTARLVSGVNAEAETAEAFARAWPHHAGQAAQVHRRMRLFRLGRLTWPDPVPEGAPRVATGRDRDLLIQWCEAFTREVDDLARQDQAAAVDERLSYGGITVWEAGGIPVSMAGVTRIAAGMARIGYVYTPPTLRGRGYAGGATAAVSQATLDCGADEILLYTDQANPTSNALYPRLGYRPVEDLLVLSFKPAGTSAQ
jgi:RimJ/RimL family protein N-acetyltransferase